jgi:integrase
VVDHAVPTSETKTVRSRRSIALDPTTVAALREQHVRRAGLPKIRLHDLRHSYASAALAAGIAAKVVSERLGHATIAITLDTYSHVLPGLDERAAATVAQLILEGDGPARWRKEVKREAPGQTGWRRRTGIEPA